MTRLSTIEVFEQTRSALIFEYGPAADQNNVLGLVSGLACRLVAMRLLHSCSIHFDEMLEVRRAEPDPAWDDLLMLESLCACRKAAVSFYSPKNAKSNVELIAVVRLKDSARTFCVIVTWRQPKLIDQIKPASSLCLKSNQYCYEALGARVAPIKKGDPAFEEKFLLLTAAIASSAKAWQEKNAVDFRFTAPPGNESAVREEVDPFLKRMILLKPVTTDKRMMRKPLPQTTHVRACLTELIDCDSHHRNGASLFRLPGKVAAANALDPHAVSFEELLDLFYRRLTGTSWFRHAIAMRKHRGHAIAIREKTSYSERITSWLTAHVNKKDLFHTYPHAAKLTGTTSLACLFVALIPGCTSLTGLNATDSFSCPKAPGVSCSSLHETYEMNAAGLLPHQRKEELPVIAAPNSEETMPEKALSPVAKVEVRSPVASATGTTNVDSVVEKSVPPKTRENSPAPKGNEIQNRESAPRLEHQEAAHFLAAAPQRRPEEIIRITIAPWTDSDGDLHEGHRLYMRVKEASWMTPHRENAGRSAVVSLPFAVEPALSGKSAIPQHEEAGRSSSGTSSSSDALRMLRDAYAEELAKVLPSGSNPR
ncbi:TraV family lipoprotein [uncultured Sutterella sp.]|uniref:TraV family lipoprotein n=1 Tax=uncultured Sutterella sp. TaxID=286133 RepID=UPI00262BFED9|nr:TraV family lipoprotein [uncultured Sutterella sp.]